MSISIIIVEKTGILKPIVVKNFQYSDLYKKCGFKKEDGFSRQTEWQTKVNGKKYIIQMFGKSDGKANMENKYDFPPPIDNILFFGSCALICLDKDTNVQNLTLELWEKIYEKLFGGFEELVRTNKEDELEDDELEHIPKHMKTKKGGYLKDGFVVDSEEDEEEEEWETEKEEESYQSEEIEADNIDDIGSELSEESYI
jgi:hypothetical protein